MSAAAAAVDHYLQLAEKAGQVRRAPLPDWLAEQRSAAIAELGANGFPTRRQEAWRYTSLDKLLTRRFQIADSNGAPTPVPDTAGLQLVSRPAARLVFCDGRFLGEQSDIDNLPPGLTVSNLADMNAAEFERLAGRLGSALGDDLAVFESINTALMDDGLFLEVAPDTVLQDPVEIIYTSQAEATEVVAPLRHLVVMQPGSQATLVEHFSSAADARNFTNCVTELVLDEHARLAHYRLQNEAVGNIHKSTVAIKQAASSDYRGIAIDLGAQWSRTDYRVRFSAEDAACRLAGLYITSDDHQLSDFHIDIDHAVPACRSQEHFKGILLGESRAVFDGRVNVAVNAQKTDAHLKNDNLLLSRKAEIDSKPVLEIFADDVRCSHGTTVGQIDDEQLYYLRSRGIDESLGRRMLCSGFAREVLDECTVATFADYATTAIEQCL